MPLSFLRQPDIKKIRVEIRIIFFKRITFEVNLPKLQHNCSTIVKTEV